MSPFFRKIALYIVARPRLVAKLMKFGLNWFPAIRRTGCKVTAVSPDVRYIRVELPLNWKTRNINGTIFGGSMFAATDPFYMSILYFNLGDDYVVWDKGGTIRFKRPGRGTLVAEFKVDEAELTEIRDLLAFTPEIDRVYPVQLIDQKGYVCAEVERVLYIAHKSAYDNKMAERRAKRDLLSTERAGD
ncbi:MAG: hypothetical protein RL571_2266 [Pseudomonadota bacterium]|jgi:acyl-coenzyme A thioesterase PaaI-like protein